MDKYASLGGVFQRVLDLGLVEAKDNDFNAFLGPFNGFQQGRGAVRRLNYQLQWCSFVSTSMNWDVLVAARLPEYLDAALARSFGYSSALNSASNFRVLSCLFATTHLFGDGRSQ
jgi:hypothetical protein